MICGQCEYNDGLVYASNPVKYKCTKDGKYYEGNHRCSCNTPKKYIKELHQELVGNLYAVKGLNGTIKIEGTPEGIAQVLWRYGYRKVSEGEQPVMIAMEGFNAEVASHLCCPRCKNPIVSQFVKDYKPKHCSECGQKLDWSEVK